MAFLSLVSAKFPAPVFRPLALSSSAVSPLHHLPPSRGVRGSRCGTMAHTCSALSSCKPGSAGTAPGRRRGCEVREDNGVSETLGFMEEAAFLLGFERRGFGLVGRKGRAFQAKLGIAVNVLPVLNPRALLFPQGSSQLPGGALLSGGALLQVGSTSRTLRAPRLLPANQRHPFPGPVRSPGQGRRSQPRWTTPSLGLSDKFPLLPGPQSGVAAKRRPAWLGASEHLISHLS